MYLDTKVIKSLLLDYMKTNDLNNTDQLTQWLYDGITMFDDLYQNCQEIEKKKRDISLRYKKEIEELEKDVREYQDICCHDSTEYHGDPSGGTDSFTRCNLCGKEF